MLAVDPRPEARPALTVIIPLGDARIDAIGQVRSWTLGQTMPRERYQVIAVGDGTAPDVEAAIAADMAPHDQLVRCAPGEHVVARSLIGARHAAGDILVFAEHHVIAAPDCVEAANRYFDQNPAIAGGTLEWHHRDGAAHGHLDAKWFAQMRAMGQRSGGWEVLRTGEYGLRRAAYFALGGHQSRYGLFADTILSARARDTGIALATIRGARITHISATMRDHLHHIADYTAGECTWRAEFGDVAAERSIGHAHAWANRAGLDAATNLRAVVSALRALGRGLPEALRSESRPRFTRLAREAIRRMYPDLLGARYRIARAWLKTHWSALRATRLGWRRDARWAHFERSWRGMIEVTRLRAAMMHAREPAFLPPRSGAWPIAEIPPAHRVGFHGLEMDGVEFRWSEPIVMLRLAPMPGRCRVTIKTRPTRGAPLPHLRGAFWGARRVGAISGGEDRINLDFAVGSRGPRWLILVIDPWFAPGDERRLGLPITSVSVEPIA